MDSYSLKSVSDLPDPFRATFSFRYFNSLQSECFSACFHSDINMVISAPTGSGKTVLFELCILRILSKFINQEGRFNHTKGTLKTIYISPSKALVQEKLRSWNQKLGSWGINCLELTGDNESYNIRNIQEADIILTTPEKFDAVTRLGIKNGGLSFFSDISLVLIDEVHLLNDPRGAALEAIVSRIKMIGRSPKMKTSPLAHVRFIAVSATIPNIDDLGEWLMVPIQGIKRFGEEMRPVKLTTKVFGYTPAKNDFLFEKRLQNYIFDLLMQYSSGKSALVFCSTRKGAQEAAQRLAQTVMTHGYSNPFVKSMDQQERLREASLSCGDKQMQSYILYGVGYHNGGLSPKDRSLIEGLFLNGDLQVLCTTNTLAHGINLPAHTVIIKSTQYYNKEKGIYTEYDRSMILQMCGRAGRPPFDDTGMVIIMTRRETVHLYENLLGGCELVESQLLSCVTEHLVAEVVQLTVSDITRAIEWMKCSYLYVRMKKNPQNYAVKKGLSGIHIEQHIQEVCVQKVKELTDYQMIWTDEDGFMLKPLEPGSLMTKYYLKFDTMKHIMKAPANCSIEDALNIVCRAEEISWIQLRRNEKKLLNDINADKDGRLRFHVLGDKGKKKKRIQTREEKLFILANDCLTGDPLAHDLSLTQDTNSVCSNGCRIAKCMKEYFIYKKNYKGALNSSLLAKSLHQKLWEDSPYLLKQLPGIGMVTAKALQSMGVKSFETLSEADPRKIEMVTGRKFPFGNHIKESLLSLPPKVDLKVEEMTCPNYGKSKLVMTLTRLSQSPQTNKRHYADVVVATEEDNMIIFHEKISPYIATILVTSHLQGKLTVKADLIFEEFIGIDLHQKVILMKDMNSNIYLKNGTKKLSLPPSTDVCIVEPKNNYSPKVPAGRPQKPLKSKNEEDSIPSFKLLDEDSDEGESVVENDDYGDDDDDCKIINEITVFDHIREKAKSLPSYTVTPTTEYPPSLETLSLIRKRTRERQLAIDDITEFLTNQCEEFESSEPDINSKNTLTGETIFDHIRKKSKSFPRVDEIKTLTTKSTVTDFDLDKKSRVLDLELTNTPNVRQLALDELSENLTNPCEEFESSEPDIYSKKTLSGETIFDHIRKKAKSFPRVDEIKTLASKSTVSNFDLSSDTKSIILDLESMKPRGKTGEDHDTKSIILDLKPMKPRSKAGEVHDTKSTVLDMEPMKPRCKAGEVHDIKSIVMDMEPMKPRCKAGEVHGKSPSLANRQSCSLATATETKEVTDPYPFLGFKSVFSFL